MNVDASNENSSMSENIIVTTPTITNVYITVGTKKVVKPKEEGGQVKTEIKLKEKCDEGLLGHSYFLVIETKDFSDTSAAKFKVSLCSKIKVLSEIDTPLKVLVNSSDTDLIEIPYNNYFTDELIENKADFKNKAIIEFSFDRNAEEDKKNDKTLISQTDNKYAPLYIKINEVVDGGDDIVYEGDETSEDRKCFYFEDCYSLLEINSGYVYEEATGKYIERIGKEIKIGFEEDIKAKYEKEKKGKTAEQKKEIGTKEKKELGEIKKAEDEEKKRKVYLKSNTDGYTEVASINHYDFCYIGGIVKHESGTSGLKEIRCIAYASNNWAKARKKTWQEILATAYSSVPKKKKRIFIPDTKNADTKTNLTRQVLIEVLRGGTDITNGATHWDGTDFLAWGTDENKYDHATKIGHNKFKEYKFIEIPKDVYDSFLEANKSASTIYPMKGIHDSRLKKGEVVLSADITPTCNGKHEHLTKKVKEKVKVKETNEKGVEVEKVKEVEKEIYTGSIKYPMPAQVFEDTTNWSTGNFYYETELKTGNGISATASGGKSIFWKITAKKLK